MTKKLKKELDRVIKTIEEKYRPEKIILYGSAVYGNTHKWSDLDLVIIKKTKKRFYDRIGEVLLLLYDVTETPVDVLIYTPEEYEKMRNESWFVGEEIDKKGKTVYPN